MSEEIIFNRYGSKYKYYDGKPIKELRHNGEPIVYIVKQIDNLFRIMTEMSGNKTISRINLDSSKFSNEDPPPTQQEDIQMEITPQQEDIQMEIPPQQKDIQPDFSLIMDGLILCKKYKYGLDLPTDLDFFEKLKDILIHLTINFERFQHGDISIKIFFDLPSRATANLSSPSQATEKPSNTTQVIDLELLIQYIKHHLLNSYDINLLHELSKKTKKFYFLLKFYIDSKESYYHSDYNTLFQSVQVYNTDLNKNPLSTELLFFRNKESGINGTMIDRRFYDFDSSTNVYSNKFLPDNFITVDEKTLRIYKKLKREKDTIWRGLYNNFDSMVFCNLYWVHSSPSERINKDDNFQTINIQSVNHTVRICKEKHAYTDTDRESRKLNTFSLLLDTNTTLTEQHTFTINLPSRATANLSSPSQATENPSNLIDDEKTYKIPDIPEVNFTEETFEKFIQVLSEQDSCFHIENSNVKIINRGGGKKKPLKKRKKTLKKKKKTLKKRKKNTLKKK